MPMGRILNAIGEDSKCQCGGFQMPMGMPMGMILNANGKDTK